MNELNINKESWHYWLADQGGYDLDRHDWNICVYIRKILKAVIGWSFVAAVAVIVFSLVSYMLGNFLAWITACLVTWMWIDPDPVVWAILITGSAALIALIGYGFVKFLVYCMERYIDHRQEIARTAVKSPPPTPSFVSEAWRNFHDKTCVRIKFD